MQIKHLLLSRNHHFLNQKLFKRLKKASGTKSQLCQKIPLRNWDVHIAMDPMFSGNVIVFVSLISSQDITL